MKEYRLAKGWRRFDTSEGRKIVIRYVAIKAVEQDHDGKAILYVQGGDQRVKVDTLFDDIIAEIFDGVFRD
jgi:hypothetical protein